MKTSSPGPSPDPRDALLEQQVSKNWYMLGTVAVFSTVGMAIATAPMLAERLGTVWPWPNTHVVLLCGLVISVAMLVAYLTKQQQRVSEIRVRVSKMEEEEEARSLQNTIRLRALLNISKMMGAVTDPENVFKHITETCLEIFECQQASLMLLNDAKDELEVKASTGHRSDVTGNTQKVGSGIAGWVAKTQEPLILNPDTNLSQYPGLEHTGRGVTAAMVVPIVVRDELVGVLNASSRRKETSYTHEDLRSLSVFAENAGTVIRHSEHAEWMRQTIERLRHQLDRMQESGVVHKPQHS
jgi:transcriptional regulator with GAF, ATPase, and Fis domain